MACLYAATGDGIARLDESGDAWTVELFLSASGAQCLAVDPDDPNTVVWPCQGRNTPIKRSNCFGRGGWTVRFLDQNDPRQVT